MYTAGGVQHSERSPKNLRIAKLFTDREVKMELTEVVEYVFDTATDQNAPPFSLDDIQSAGEVACPYCGAEALEELYLTHEVSTYRYNPDADLGEEYSCPICGSVYASEEEARSCCVGITVFQCQNCANILQEDEYDALLSDTHLDKIEWWGVTEWFVKKLQDLGETVILNPPIWGRTPSESPIYEEDVVLEICKNIGILEGQPHEWKFA